MLRPALVCLLALLGLGLTAPAACRRLAGAAMASAGATASAMGSGTASATATATASSSLPTLVAPSVTAGLPAADAQGFPLLAPLTTPAVAKPVFGGVLGIPASLPAVPTRAATVPATANAGTSASASTSAPTSVPATGGPATGGSCPDPNAALQAHNAARAARGAPALAWSPSLAASAQAWASRCAFQHSYSGVGENLFLSSGGATCADAVHLWVSEGASGGHYTQVVWRSTTQVGCGLASCPIGTEVVCQYSPPGNVIGQEAANL